MTAHDAGRYQLTSRVATGGMGEVWRAEDTVLDREVAVKVLKHEYADDPSFRARFEAEARHAAALTHPNVASVFDFGELESEDGSGVRRPFLVMELVPGQPLSALLRSGEPMPPERAADVVAQAAEAISAAHALGIVHRDVKPANLLVTPDGTVKITDFGIARAGSGAAITQTGQIIGTPHYISPEQAEGRPASAASDIYALGVVLYECLAGRRPFSRDTPIQVALAHIREEVPPLGEEVPAGLRAVADRALAKDPADRFATASEMAAALRAGAASGFRGLPPGATQVLVPAERVPEASRNGRSPALPAWWPWAAAAAVVLAVVLGSAALTGSPGSDPAVATEGTAAEEEPSARPAASEEPLDDRVRVREAEYLGRDFKEVKDRLEALGLKVEEHKVAAVSPDQLKDTVAGIEPAGLVEPDSTVRVEVFEAYVEPEPLEDDDDDGGDDDGDKGGGGKDDKAEKPGKGKAKGKSD